MLWEFQHDSTLIEGLSYWVTFLLEEEKKGGGKK